jgi:starch phosphorylase
MVREYAERMYIPATRESQKMREEDWSLARSMALEADRLERGWGETRFGDVKIDAPYDIVLGQGIDIAVEVYLGKVEPDDVIVEAIGGSVDGTRRIVDGDLTVFERVVGQGDGQASSGQTEPPPGWHRYRGTWRPRAAGHNGCLIRLRPRFSQGAPARELPVRFWE